MNKFSKKATMALAAVAALAVGGGITAALATGDSSAPDVTTQLDVAQAVPSALSDRYAVFKQKADPIPGNGVAAAEYGQNGALARALGDSGYYAVPGNDNAVCLVTAAGSGVCSRADLGTPTTLTSAMCLDGRQVLRFVALFPDDVTTVEISGTGTEVDRAVAVKSNAVSIDLPTDSKGEPSLSWTGADGRHSETITVPSGAGQMFCGDRTP